MMNFVWFLLVVGLSNGAQESNNQVITTTRIEEEKSHDQPVKPSWNFKDGYPQNVYAEPLGSMVKLRCPVKGWPTPNITWVKDGVPIEDISRPAHIRPYQLKSEKWELKIHGLLKSDQGKFTCIIENSEGRIKHTFQVDVLDYISDKPKLVSQTSNLTLLQGMTANFQCKFESDLAIFVYWLRPVKALRNSAGNNENAILDGSNKTHFETIQDKPGHNYVGENFTIKNVTPEDAGWYFCVGTTNAGRETGFLHLAVLKDEEAILKHPENVTAEVGQNAFMTCKSHGNLQDHTSWVKILENENDIQILKEGSEVLEIKNVTLQSEGLYACVVGNHESTIVSEAYLSVQNPITIIPINDPRNLKVIAIVSASVLIPLIAFIIWLAKRWHKEHKERKLAVANAHAVTQWTKKVIIERRQNENTDEVSAPEIHIVKSRPSVNTSVSGGGPSRLSSRSRFGSQNTTLTNITEYELPLDICWEFPREQICLEKVIGEGAFGKVMKATAANILKLEDKTTVAIKMLKEGHTDQDMIDLVSEMDMMKMIGRHINIINLLGVCTQTGPLFVIVEFAEHGNLRDFLRKRANAYEGYEQPNDTMSMRNLTEKQLLSFARQICKGMEYLGSRKCIHRDLAARNVLVAKDYVIKIADFGLARDVQKNEYYRKKGEGFLPVRWMSPEALFYRRYTIQSDVWSFGVLFWEIMSLGGQPYPEIPNTDNLFSYLRNGHRMERPIQCSIDAYMIMRECWNNDPLHRPLFSDLVENFDCLLTMAKESNYLEMSEAYGCAGPPEYTMGWKSAYAREQPGLFTTSNTGETLIADGDSIYAPKPPSMFPLMYQNSSTASSGLGSADGEVTYAPIMTSCYAPNLIYNDGKEAELSTFRPPPTLTSIANSMPTNSNSTNMEMASFYPSYANQQYSNSNFPPKNLNSFETSEEDEDDDDVDEGVMSAATLTPAEDYSKQYGEQMESSSL